MAPQTRSTARRVTRSSTRANASSHAERATISRKASTSKPSVNRKVAPKSKQKSEPKPARKRVRRASIESETAFPSTAPKRAKPSAKLEIFMNMPVEVFIEIAKYLHPFDLVLLSRVNKFFRELFMSRRASPIWREAQLSVEGLPPCPKSICEPQYAAMLFTKMCSNCGKWAPRNMDPILLVRLCVKCREEQAVDTSIVTDRTLVFTSRDLVPGKNRYVSWCLYDDAKAVKSKLNELVAAGDKEVKELWVQERRKEVGRRHEDALPLKQWLKAREQAREAELEQVRGARQAEIESRLVNLGWEKNDIHGCDYWRKKQWKSLTYNAKPLTDRAWEELLPSLLGYLEMNREQRFEREKADRRYTRTSKLREWLLAVKNQLEPLARAIANDGSPAPTSTEGAHWNEHERNNMLLQQSFPSMYHACTWPEFKALQDTDVPIEDFTATLSERADMLKNLITEWRNTFEATLVKALPEDTPAPAFNDVPDFTFAIGTGDHTQPTGGLPVGLQKLLRADAIFTGYQVSFYPDDFASTDPDPSKVTYSAEAANIAKALLKALNRPNASYLELKALGSVFQCGRCNVPAQYMSWKNIVQHYLNEVSEWRRISQTPHVRRAKFFTYALTHNVDMVNPNKPLIRIVEESNKVAYPFSLNSTLCKLCRGVNITRTFKGDHVIDHIRDVHLIEEPKLGEHY